MRLKFLSVKKIYKEFQEQPDTAELEFRIYKIGKASKTLDKFTFYYLQDYFLQNFKYIVSDTIDITENRSMKSSKIRSTYYNYYLDVVNGASIHNEYKEKVSDYTFEPKNVKNKLYNNLGFKLALSNEIETNKVVGLRSQVAGKIVNNQIRFKNRYSFTINKLWQVDMTKVISGYTLEDLKDKNETFELECEYIGDETLNFEDFITSMDNLFKLILLNSNYCDSCV
jgi:hypothetical protein